MKKLIALLLIGLLCVTATACSGTPKTAKADSPATSDNAQTVEPEDLVVSEKYYNVYAYEENGEKSQDTVTVYEYEFDSEGHPTKTTAVTDGQVASVKEMEYNDAGNVVRQTNFVAEGSKTSVFEYTYDDNNKTKFVISGADGKVNAEITYEYDENGYLVSESYQSDDHAYTIRHENDADGKEIASVQYDADGKEMMKTECEYNSDGLPVRKNQSFDNGSGSPGSSNVEYEYDSRGNVVKEVCYDANGGILYSYDRVYKTVKELSGK